MERGIIKAKCEEARKIIIDAEAILRICQAACKHEDTFEGLWSWRIGSTMPATICSICGGLVKMQLPNIEANAKECDERDDEQKLGT